MTAHGPCGLSFRALTILIEHIENNGDWPIAIHDPPRVICTTSLIARGFLRPKNSRLTTITKHGHEQFLKAAGKWAEFLERAELKKQESASTIRSSGPAQAAMGEVHRQGSETVQAAR